MNAYPHVFMPEAVPNGTTKWTSCTAAECAGSASLIEAGAGAGVRKLGGTESGSGRVPRKPPRRSLSSCRLLTHRVYAPASAAIVRIGHAAGPAWVGKRSSGWRWVQHLVLTIASSRNVPQPLRTPWSISPRLRLAKTDMVVAKYVPQGPSLRVHMHPPHGLVRRAPAPRQMDAMWNVRQGTLWLMVARGAQARSVGPCARQLRGPIARSGLDDDCLMPKLQAAFNSAGASRGLLSSNANDARRTHAWVGGIEDREPRGYKTKQGRSAVEQAVSALGFCR